MKSFTKSLILGLSFFATTAYAASGNKSEDMGALTLLFLGFLALVIAMQFIPGLVLFYSMIRGIFSKTEHPSALRAQGNDKGQTD